MRAANNALSYAILSLQRPQREQRWRADALDEHDTTDQAFRSHVDALCAVAQDVREAHTGVGARTAARIRDRVEKREAGAMRRTALDLQRLADLDERMRLRQAESERRRWFVLGRLLARAATEDPQWRHVMDMLLARTTLTSHEAKALGLRQVKPDRK